MPDPMETRPLHLLVIERDGELAARWVAALRGLPRDCQAEIAAYPPQAMRRLAAGDYDLVLLGDADPGSLGMDTLWEMRCRGFDVPVLAITTGALDGEASRGLGVVQFFPAEEGYERFLPHLVAGLLARESLAAQVEELRGEVSRMRTNLTAKADAQALDGLRGQLLDRVISSQEAERKSLAEDIHDESLQALATCLYKVDLTYRFSEMNESERALLQLRELRTTLSENIERLRNLIFELRPSTLDTLGLLPTLDALLAKFEEETGVGHLLRSDIGQRLSARLETMVYRLVQAALDNVRKHAHATSVFVSLKRIEDTLRVVVEDNGVGFAADAVLAQALDAGRLGLAAMRERVQLAGGHFAVDSGPGEGTRVIVVLPFEPVRPPETVNDAADGSAVAGEGPGAHGEANLIRAGG